MLAQHIGPAGCGQFVAVFAVIQIFFVTHVTQPVEQKGARVLFAAHYLERIGDQAVNIAERALELNSNAPLQIPIDIKVMADMALGMVTTSIDAFVHQNPKLAIKVCQRDVEVDLLDDEYTCTFSKHNNSKVLS